MAQQAIYHRPQFAKDTPWLSVSLHQLIQPIRPRAPTAAESPYAGILGAYTSLDESPRILISVACLKPLATSSSEYNAKPVLWNNLPIGYASRCLFIVHVVNERQFCPRAVTAGTKNTLRKTAPQVCVACPIADQQLRVVKQQQASGTLDLPLSLPHSSASLFRSALSTGVAHHSFVGLRRRRCRFIHLILRSLICANDDTTLWLL